MNEETLPPEIVAGLRRMGLTGAASVRGERLTGGVVAIHSGWKP